MKLWCSLLLAFGLLALVSADAKHDAMNSMTKRSTSLPNVDLSAAKSIAMKAFMMKKVQRSAAFARARATLANARTGSKQMQTQPSPQEQEDSQEVEDPDQASLDEPGLGNDEKIHFQLFLTLGKELSEGAYDVLKNGIEAAAKDVIPGGKQSIYIYVEKSNDLDEDISDIYSEEEKKKTFQLYVELGFSTELADAAFKKVKDASFAQELHAAIQGRMVGKTVNGVAVPAITGFGIMKNSVAETKEEDPDEDDEDEDDEDEDEDKPEQGEDGDDAAEVAEQEAEEDQGNDAEDMVLGGRLDFMLQIELQLESKYDDPLRNVLEGEVKKLLPKDRQYLYSERVHLAESGMEVDEEEAEEPGEEGGASSKTIALFVELGFDNEAAASETTASAKSPTFVSKLRTGMNTALANTVVDPDKATILRNKVVTMRLVGKVQLSQERGSVEDVEQEKQEEEEEEDDEEGHDDEDDKDAPDANGCRPSWHCNTCASEADAEDDCITCATGYESEVSWADSEHTYVRCFTLGEKGEGDNGDAKPAPKPLKPGEEEEADIVGLPNEHEDDDAEEDADAEEDLLDAEVKGPVKLGHLRGPLVPTHHPH
jgi:hypothetical protein